MKDPKCWTMWKHLKIPVMKGAETLKQILKDDEENQERIIELNNSREYGSLDLVFYNLRNQSRTQLDDWKVWEPEDSFSTPKNSPQISGKVVNFSQTNTLNNIILETNFNNPSRYDDLAGDVRDEPDPPTGHWDGWQAWWPRWGYKGWTWPASWPKGWPRFELGMRTRDETYLRE